VIKFRLLRPVLALGVLALARPAFADATAFIGMTTTPSTRLAKGFSIGVSMIIVGFEFEYSSTSQDDEAGAPGLRTGMFNGLVQTPNTGSIQAYFTIGGGFYREKLETPLEDVTPSQETNFGINTGGGVKIPLAGPLRVRVDYRLFRLYGSPLHDRSQRIYAGVNFAF
jgi:opacity protein-like surface antigen